MPRAPAPAHGGPPGHVGPPVHAGPLVHVGVGFHYGYYPWWGFGFNYGWYPFYRPWYAGWYGYGWWPPYAYGYPPYPYYGPYGGDGNAADMTSASVRLEVKPRDAEVYVDGYLAGKVDDFDGTFQRLHVPPGDHELVLYRDGYRTVKQHVTLTPNSDQKVQFAMEPLAPGETAEARPVPPAPEAPQTQQEPPQSPPPGYGRGAPPPPQTPPQEPTSSTFGSLSLNVQPADAEIIVDGAPWTIPPGEPHLILRLPEGKHHVEIRKPGLATYTEDVGIQRGRTLTLNVSLHDLGGAR
ncbi:MAG TPA: PEGA domain-containing protein [Vicinamibacterales bacterium]|nr:PEGA domain-containing protein [Vicinamibacterales bacterium]